MGHLPPLNHKIAQVLHGLHKTSKHLPSTLLYDKSGSEIYEEITRLDEYYLYTAELRLFHRNAQRIAITIPPGTLVVELGCGTATKTAVLLDAITAFHGSCRYAGIDVSGTALSEGRDTLLRNVKGLSSADVFLVEEEYLEGLRQVKQRFPNDMLCIMWLGSSVGNLSKEGAITFFQEVLEVVGSRCQVFLCADLWKDEKTLYAAYCDEKGVCERFIKNGMKNALSLLGHVITQEEEQSWIYQVDVNKRLKRVELRIVFPKGLHIEKDQVHIRCGENVLMGVSRKFTIQDIQELAAKSGFCIHEAWRNKIYGCQMLLPSFEALLRCWADTDAMFSGIKCWNARPIDLRHPFGFYYGHVNAFAKVKLLPALGSSKFDQMFSRAMDPIVLEPTKCHSQPDVPREWPSMESISNYAKTTRSAVKEAVEKGKVSMRLVSLVLEHDRMHQETLAYMLAQERKLMWESNNTERNAVECSNDDKWLIPEVSNLPNISIPAGEVVLGVAHDEEETGVFLWDNEQPTWRTTVSNPFLVSSMAVTIGEFMRFVLEGGYEREELWEAEDFAFFERSGFKWPATWSMNGRECYVHDPYCTKHWSEVMSNPVYVSLSEAEAYCKWVGEGCRVMREEEYERAVDVSESEEEEEGGGGMIRQLRDGGWEWTSSVFKGYPGFKAMGEYSEYSTDFFDGKHYVLKGRSGVTHPSLCRHSFRNFYERHNRYVFAKFRCCK